MRLQFPRTMERDRPQEKVHPQTFALRSAFRSWSQVKRLSDRLITVLIDPRAGAPQREREPVVPALVDGLRGHEHRPYSPSLMAAATVAWSLNCAQVPQAPIGPHRSLLGCQRFMLNCSLCQVLSPLVWGPLVKLTDSYSAV